MYVFDHTVYDDEHGKNVMSQYSVPEMFGEDLFQLVQGEPGYPSYRWVAFHAVTRRKQNKQRGADLNAICVTLLLLILLLLLLFLSHIICSSPKHLLRGHWTSSKTNWSTTGTKRTICFLLPSDNMRHDLQNGSLIAFPKEENLVNKRKPMHQACYCIAPGECYSSPLLT